MSAIVRRGKSLLTWSLVQLAQTTWTRQPLGCSAALQKYASTLTQPTDVLEVSVDAEGVKEGPYIDPLKEEDFFGVSGLFTLKDLFNARVHLGHKAGLRNPHMLPYLFGNRLGVDIIDLDKTVPLLKDALNFTAHIAFNEGIILFISRDRQTMPIVEQTAQECGEYSHCRYWKGGTFTNATTQFGLVTRLPDLCIFVNTQNSVFEQHVAVVESAKLNIPTVGIVDSGCDPRLITYPIPGNDDTPCAVKLYCRLFKETILQAKEKKKEMQHSEDKTQK